MNGNVVALPEITTVHPKVRARRTIQLATRYKVDEHLLEAGVDEVARGCLFGPVYAGAVILNPDIPVHPWLNDSKRVTKLRRAQVRKWIEETAIAWSVGHVHARTIDRINIRNAAMMAMNDAIEKLKIRPDLLLVDGDYFLPSAGNRGIAHVTIVAGDAKYANIAAASILAKEHHDEYIRKMIADDESLNDKYELGKNVGYGTKKHIDGLRQHGKHDHHRVSFLGRILTREALGLKKLDLFTDTSDEEEA